MEELDEEDQNQIIQWLWPVSVSLISGARARRAFKRICPEPLPSPP